MKKYAEQSEAKKKYIKIKRGPKKLNFGASKPGVRGWGSRPLGPPLDPLVEIDCLCLEMLDISPECLVSKLQFFLLLYKKVTIWFTF